LIAEENKEEQEEDGFLADDSIYEEIRVVSTENLPQIL
jgi:hypothetical protein